MEKKHHQKHKQHLHRQPDAYELYELEHMPHELMRARSGHVRPGPEACPIFTSDDNYESEIGIQPHKRPIEGGNGVIFKPDYYESGGNMQSYWSSPVNINGIDCKENVDCEAEKFITLEHEKFALSNWKFSMKK